jgi:hypothetical protein
MGIQEGGSIPLKWGCSRLLYRGDTFFDFSGALTQESEQQIDSNFLRGIPHPL